MNPESHADHEPEIPPDLLDQAFSGDSEAQKQVRAFCSGKFGKRGIVLKVGQDLKAVSFTCLAGQFEYHEYDLRNPAERAEALHGILFIIYSLL